MSKSSSGVSVRVVVIGMFAVMVSPLVVACRGSRDEDSTARTQDGGADGGLRTPDLTMISGRSLDVQGIAPFNLAAALLLVRQTIERVLKPHPLQTFPLEQAPKANEPVEERSHDGKIALAA